MARELSRRGARRVLPSIYILTLAFGLSCRHDSGVVHPDSKGTTGQARSADAGTSLPTPKFFVTGTVTREDGSSVVGAVIAAFALDAGPFEEPGGYTRSRQDGSFRLALAKGHEYSITVANGRDLPAYASTLGPTGVKEGHLDIQLGGSSNFVLNGKLVDSNGKPKPGALVVAHPADRKPHEAYVGVADEKGRYELALDERNYLLIGTAPGSTYAIERVDLRKSATRELDIQLRPPPTAPPANLVARLNKHALSLSTGKTQALEPKLRKRFCSARVLGIGESTHGSKEFALLRGRILFDLAQACRFNVLLLENDMSIGARLDDYVMGGDGEPGALLVEAASWPFAHRTLVELLREIRRYNQRSKSPIRVLGFDPYSTNGAVRGLLDYFAKRDRKLAADLSTRLAPFELKDFARSYRSFTPDKRLALRRALGDAKAALEKTPRGGRSRWLRAQLELRTLESVERLFSAKAADYGSVREQVMAENIQWLLDVYVDKGSAIVWAHNGHVLLSRPVLKVDSLGDLLSRSFPRQFLSIGVFFGSGSFGALKYANGKVDGFDVFEFGAPSPKTLEAKLAKIGKESFVIDLATLEPDLRAWFSNELEQRQVGALYTPGSTGVSEESPGLSYHMVAYIDKLSAIEPLDGVVRRAAR